MTPFPAAPNTKVSQSRLDQELNVSNVKWKEWSKMVTPMGKAVNK